MGVFDDKDDKHKEVVYSVDDIKKLLYTPKKSTTPKDKILVYGQDGTGKTSVAIELVEKMVKGTDKKAIIIDLDDYGGADQTIEIFHPQIRENVVVMHPIVLDIDGIDKKATFENIKKYCYYIQLLVNGNEPIVAVIFDGLSNLLKLAEWDMREQRSIAPDGGVNTRMWQVRNQSFNDVIMSVHNLPVSVIYVAHEDFIPNTSGSDTDGLSSIKAQMNRRCEKKVLCYAHNIPGKLGNDKSVKLYAEIQKGKFKPEIIGRSFLLFERDPENKKIKWDASEFVEAVLGQG